MSPTPMAPRPGKSRTSRPAASYSPRQTSDAPAPTICPLLGTFDRHGVAASAVEYPSFENRCLASGDGEQIMLTEQATFCLSATHKSCPRFVASAAQHEPIALLQDSYAYEPPAGPSSIIGLNDDLAGGIDGDESPEESAARRRKWSWIGAAMIFVSVLMCGGIFAVYVGWQIANSSYTAIQPGTVDTLADLPAQPQIYLVVTATSEPDNPPPQEADSNGQQPQGQQPQGELSQSIDPSQLPQAVTPTPIAVGPEGAIQLNSQPQALNADNPTAGNPPGGVDPIPNAQTEPDPALQAPNASFDALALEIPTRRPTPILDIPTSTPAPPEAMLSWPTPVPPPATPLVLFSALDEILEPGECTTITWNVEHVQAVYFDSIGVDGHGSREVCMRDKPLDYVLTVLFADGNPRYYTTTVDYLAPTPTPTPTFTFTPEPYLTPTWTPVPPTSTPTPNISYGAVLSSQGGTTVMCAANSPCELNLLVTNAGSAIDNLAVEINDRGAWPAQVCRLDGVCDMSSLIIAGMGPGNTALVKIVVQVPDPAEYTRHTYTLRAVSHGSGHTVASNSLQLYMEAGQ